MSDELHIADIIFAYIKGTISPNQKIMLEQWLARDPENRKLFRQLLSSESYRRQSLPNAHRFDQYSDFSKVQRKIKRRKFYLRRYTSIAAVAMLAVAIMGICNYYMNVSTRSVVAGKLTPGTSAAILTLSDGTTCELDRQQNTLTDQTNQIVNHNNKLIYENTSNSVEDTIEIYNTISVPRGAEYEVVLSDGTKLMLNSESSVRYPVQFKQKKRKIWITGEVFLDVAKNAARPFEVHHRQFTINVLGTSFNVRAYASEAEISTTLVSGSVKMQTITGSVHTLTPDHQLVYDKTQGTVHVNEVDTEIYTSWKDGVYVFDNQSLDLIMNQISRWYDIDVRYKDEYLKHVAFSGRLKRYENAESLLDAFEQIGDIEFTVRNKMVTIAKK